MSLTFFVAGTPAPQGSKRAFIHKRGKRAGRIGMVEMSKRVKPWREMVASCAMGASRLHDFDLRAMPCPVPKGTPVQVKILFWLSQPKTLRSQKPTKRPDLDKLVRSTLDALTGIIYEDDSQVVSIITEKDWASTQSGATITVTAIQ